MLTYCVYAPLLNLIDGLKAYLNLSRLDMSSRFAGPLNAIYNFETASSKNQIDEFNSNTGGIAS
jgi:hypothetical protein